jgi:hypothetical protein
MSNFKEYIDNGDNYEYPERQTENEILDIRLYCDADNCNVYIKGKEDYNGSFIAETGQRADLRNQCFVCSRHTKLKERKEKINKIKNG